MRSRRGSVAFQATTWTGLLVLALLAGRGPIAHPSLVFALVCLLIVAGLGVVATTQTAQASWAPAALTAWPVMARSVAAAIDDPGARLIVMSLSPLTVVFAVWWLTDIVPLRRWFAAMATLPVLAAIVADLAFRNPYREQFCHPLCSPSPWVIDHRPGLTMWAQWSVLATVIVAGALTTRAVGQQRPSVWRMTMTCIVFVLAVMVGLEGTRRLRHAPGSSLASAWAASQLLLITAAVAVGLAPVAIELLRRRRVARWATVIEDATTAGGVVAMLRHEVGDPSVKLVGGSAADASAEPGRATTAFSRNGRVVATLEHRPESADRIRALAASPVVAALENDSLFETARHELAELRSARRSVVERGDATRRRLQRDLHDGAQQRLILLGLELSALADVSSEPRRSALEQAALDSGSALAGLRRVAHRNLPHVLDERGLGEALTSLAEDTLIPIVLRVDALSGRRFAPDVERAAYRFVAASAELAHREGLPMTVTTEIVEAPEPMLVVSTSAKGRELADRTADEDRVGAAGGWLQANLGDGQVHYEARFPCE